MRTGRNAFAAGEGVGLVSPLVDVVFNLMITMFVFLMIYMAVVIPTKILPVEVLYPDEMPIAIPYRDWVAGVRIRNGSGDFLFAIEPAPEARRLVMVDDRLQDPGWRRSVRDVVDLEIEPATGMLRGRWYAGAVPERGTAGTATLDVIVIDRNRKTNGGQLAEQWGDVCLDFSRPREVPADEPDADTVPPRARPCFEAARGRLTVPVWPEAVPFDPIQTPLQVPATVRIEGTVGMPIEPRQIPIFGGIEPYELTVKPRGPDMGVRVDAIHGVIGGTPTAAGTFAFEVAMKDGQTAPRRWDVAVAQREAAGHPYATMTVEVAVAPREPLGCALVVPEYARVGEEIHGSVTSTGGHLAKSYAATALPAGVTIDATTGRLGGAPQRTGSYELAVTVTDQDPDRARGTCGARLASFRVIPARPERRVLLGAEP